MTKFIVLAIGMGALATSAFAQSGIADIDANGDGLLTLDEIQAIYPEIGADQFSQIDSNGDGAIDAVEMSAAQEAGLLPAAPADES